MASTLLLSVIGVLPVISASGPPKVVAIRQDQASQTSGLSAAATTAAAASSVSSTAPSDDSLQILEPFNVTLDGQIFPSNIQIGGVDLNDATDFSIDCLDCSITANLSLSAGGEITTHTIDAPPDVTEIPSDFDFEDHWAAATFDSFDAVLELSVNLSASSPNNEIKVPIPLGNAFTISKTFGILTLEATLNAEIHGWINTTNDVNFTYGFQYSVPPGSEVIVDLSHVENSKSIGFNETKLTPIPLNSTRSDLNIDLELSFRPSVTLIAIVDVKVADASVGLTVDLDVPKLDVDILQVHDVTSDCKPVTPSTPADQIYSNATMVVPSVGFDTIAVFQETGKFLGVKLSAAQPFEQDLGNINLTTACFFYDAAKKALAPATQSKTKVSFAVRDQSSSFAVSVLLVTMTLMFALV